MLCSRSIAGRALQDKRGRPPARTDAQLVPPSENRLKRETPYVCNVRFHADLPEVTVRALAQQPRCCAELSALSSGGAARPRCHVTRRCWSRRCSRRSWRRSA